MAKRTMPDDSLQRPSGDDRFSGTGDAREAHESITNTTEDERKQSTKETGLVQVSTRIDADIANRARNIVWQERGLTLAAMVKEGLEHVVKAWEKENGGRAPDRPEGAKKLPTGRPMG